MVEIFNAVPNVLVNRKGIILALICMTSTLHCPGSSGLFFSGIITGESETILPLFLSYSFLFGIKIYKTFYWSSIINAGLLRDLTLGISHDHYHK